MPNEPTRAAGGIVCRPTDDGTEVLLVHRPRYDDWSLPKGHIDEGETALEAALREVREETGYECTAGDMVGLARYTTDSGEHKVVQYWAMTVPDGEFVPNDEVDRIAWVSAAEADELLSYAADRDLIHIALGLQ